MRCEYCDSDIPNNVPVCPRCGGVTSRPKATPAPNCNSNPNPIPNINTNARANYNNEKSQVFFRLIVCLFFGCLGVHKFIEGKIGMGILYLFTCGLFYIGYIYDIINYIIILTNKK